MEDYSIVALFYERSENAIDLLADKYGKLCTHIAHNILNNAADAEECVNDAFLAVWNTVPPQNPKPLISYVCRIVRNLAIAKYRANTAQKRNSTFDVALDELAEILPANDSVQDAFDASEIAAAVSTFLKGCSAQDRVIFVRRYFFADSVSDIAALVGATAHYTSVRLSRTKERLRRYLQERGVEI